MEVSSTSSVEREISRSFCLIPKVKSANYVPGNTPVYLNVYDLTPANDAYWAGFGIIHSDVEESNRSLDMANCSFKKEHPFEKMQAESTRIREKYPDRILVIVEKTEKSDDPDIDKKVQGLQI